MTRAAKETASKAKVAPAFKELDRGRKLAVWVIRRTGSPGDHESSEEEEPKYRRFGLGEKISPQARLAPFTDLAEKSLHRKLEAAGEKRAAARKLEEELKATYGQASDDEDCKVTDSRTNAFTRWKVAPVFPSLHGKKKLKG
ncbi:uncharacterized protein LOC113311336 [Papaver somniferum]|uniref:uncharacterized protein LOC113311336 n=1 Tax=Papaver somniferum TaxID=3469 RepID=UPI000E6FF313|nr:uncharacterized protein LOC113311336 [Papaver somniferum]